ncbi:response regulator [Methylomicrobium sp. RS1]|jgi:two-component system invasion response regulator UvrY|uniref:response regulator n=1 Tax=Candidatus Methylomicrobium oryzae TaxID=2802053 RepID=UPI001922AE75|nr:response regulator transcription factor [Methylomicrobium sp. RS1]MBL1264511.1 response regulator transcription factor [Methylomicrobium sp. RS1]
MIKILIADDHAVVRQGLKRIFADHPDLQVAGEAENGHEVLEQIRQTEWDIVLLDMAMPGRNGLELIKQVKTERPRLPILVFSMNQASQYAVRTLKIGASGYLTKDSPPAELVAAIRKVAQGGRYVPPNVAEKLAEQVLAAHEGLPHERLSDREYQIFELLVSGKGISLIAATLCLSIKTVSTHKIHILEKMDMSNTAELIRYAIRHRLASACADEDC